LRLAIEALEQLGLDEVILEVAAESPFKPEGHRAGVEARLAMVECAIEGSANLHVGRFETSRPSPSYAVDTIIHYATDSEVHYILGSDALVGFADWRMPERILAACTLAVFPRNADVNEALSQFPKEWRSRINTFEAPFLDIASSNIRARLAEGRSVKHLLPDCVIRLIREQRLYEVENKD
jgi:nicotinate-nucleotide adenylyltransferase